MTACDHMLMTDIEKSIIEDIEELGDELFRSEFLIRCGKVFEGIPEDQKRDEDLIKDCQTKTWIKVMWDEEVLHIKADSRSLLVKGALALICEIYEGRTKEQVRSYNCTLLENDCFASLFSIDQRRGMKQIIMKLSAAE